ncbi:NIF3-like protein 1 [Haliotis rubra]|uniref:NIF3-like protein 1 n=1 Tax=Haliotis rubra TaxID=36100 RepID=UPI001EE6035C|nr:NIF3-like protein 1 [Haliotis rubra]
MYLQSLRYISNVSNSPTVSAVATVLHDYRPPTTRGIISAPVTTNFKSAATFCQSKRHIYTYRYINVSRLSRFQQQFLPCVFKKSFLHTSLEGMELKKVVNILNEFANTSLAESWDNVGLLTEPSAPHNVRTILLTNDLTPAVLDEAIEKNADLILSYHPPIFSPMKRLTQKSWKEKLIVKCLEKRIAIYSPHTCYDALSGGVNDWLISAFDTKSTKPVEQSEACGEFGCQVDIVLETADATKLVQAVTDKSIPRRIITSPLALHEKTEQGVTRVSVSCSKSDVPCLVDIAQSHPAVISIEKRQIEKVPLVGYGMGRVGKLTSPLSLGEAVARVKTHLGLEHVRLATASGMDKVCSVAVCAGSGSSVLRGAMADLFVTGEMSHHDVLNAVSNGISVILCEHSNTERGYLKELKGKFSSLMSDQVQIFVSETDSDPLKTV